MTRDERPPSTLGKAASILLAFLPPARMAWIVFTNGENNLSNDYIARVTLVASMLDGTCSLGTFVRAASIGGNHSTLAVTPIYYLSARFFAWDARVELALGLLIAGATLALIAATLPVRARWTLLPLLSLVLFSTTKVSSFTFGESTLQMGLAQLGVAIGAFGFARRSGRPVVLAAWVAAGGVLASWSWGGGIMAWPVFFAALTLRRERKPAAWAILAGGAAAGLAQYAWLLPHGMPSVAAGPVFGAAKFRLVLDILGRPLVNGIARADPDPLSQALGAAGLAMLVAMLILLRKEFREHLAAILVVSWALLAAAEVALFRTAVASWYASPMALFWAGLLLLLAAAPAPFRAVGILLVALLTLRVQRTWEDKSYYLPSRAPASAACLREWRTAPPECHARVFQWGKEGHSGDLARLGEPLERHRLSVFGPRRTYLLQGDVAVGRVRLEPESTPSFFSRDGITPGDPNDFHRLDLVLAPGGSVTWRVDLPPNLKSARFVTRVRTTADDAMLARGARVSVTAEGSSVLLEERTFLPRETTRPSSVDLSSLAGKTITLRLSAEETHEGETPLVFEAPRVLLALDGSTSALHVAIATLAVFLPWACGFRSPGIIAAAVALAYAPALGRALRDESLAFHADDRRAASGVLREAARYVGARTAPGERIAAFPTLPIVYLEAKRRPVTDGIFFLPWQAMREDRDPALVSTCSQLEAHPPRYVILQETTIWRTFAWRDYAYCIDRFLKRAYEPVDRPELHGLVLRRRDAAADPSPSP